jgi:aerobic carbon-monoxide dehydrogenase large subunit
VPSLIGKRLPRREDLRLITGAGRYTDDLAPRDAAHAYVLRSIHPHARIAAIRTEAAREAPGVLAVLTAADYESDGHGPIRHLPNPADAIDPKRPAFDPAVEIAQPPLARDAVRYVGEPVVLVVAESAAAARDAAASVDVEYVALPAVARSIDAIADDAPQLYPEAPRNLAFDLTYGEDAGSERALAESHLVLSREFANQRVIAAHMEPRSAFASYDVDSQTYAITAGGQGVMRHRAAIAGALRVPLERVRLSAFDVGGGFGARTNVHPEAVLVAWAARRTARAVRWTADRGEGFVSDYHGRDMVVRARIGFERDGRIRALRSDYLANLGAYTVNFASMQNVVRIATGLYDVPCAHVRVRAILTNTTPTAPYRGAGRPEVTHALERLLDLAATELGIDRIEIRRRNLIRRDRLPYRSPMGLVYDAGDFHGNMERVVARADWNGFAERRARSERGGKLRGIAVANYLESPVGAPRERVTVTVRGEGVVEILTGTQSNGQGHETTFAQVAAELLDVPFESVVLRFGDTSFVTTGGGTHSNRSMRLVGTLLVKTCGELRERARGRDLFSVAREGPLCATAEISERIPAFPTGAAVCEVEIDRQTGACAVVRYTSVDDAGRVINPLILDGQTHGGIAQGIGQALFEIVDYDRETGQPQNASFMEYALPRAADVPSYDLELVEDPTEGNPLGVKGGGEAGVTPSPAVVVNAICDALRPFGADDVSMPATAEKIWAALSRAAVTVIVLIGLLASHATAQTSALVRVITPPIDAGAQPFYAQAMGFFKKAGITVEIAKASNGAAVAAAVAGGAADIGQSNLVSIASAHARGLPFVMIAGANEFVASQHQNALVVAPGSPIRTARDLNGKTVAVTGLKNITEIGFDLWFERNGGTLSSVKIIELPFAAMAAAVANGRVDAATMTVPELSEAVRTHAVKVLAYPLESIGKTWLVGGWFTTAAWAQAHPDLVRAYVAAMSAAAAWANRHQSESAKILEAATGQPVDPQTSRVPYAGELDPKAMQPVIDASAKYGAIKTPFPASELIFQRL